MNKSKNTIFTNSIVYSLGNILLKAFSFFLVPLYTAYLSTEEYGIINLSSSFYSTASSLLMLGLQYAVVRYYAEYKKDLQKIAKVFGTSICFISIISILFLFICVLSQKYISAAFFNGLDFYPIVFLSVIISITAALYTIYQDILKGMQKAKSSIVLSYVYFFLQLFSNIITVVYLKQGPAGIIISTFIVNSIMVVVMLKSLINHKLLSVGIDFPILKELLTYSIPLVPHTIAYQFSNYATKLIISTKLSFSMLGLYSLASQFGNVSDIILNSVQSAFQPWMYDLLNQNELEGKISIKKVTYLLMWLYGLMYILIGLFSQEAIIIMASKKEFIKAWMYVPLIVGSIALKSPLYFYQNLLYYDKNKTKYVFISTLFGSIVNVMFTWLLVPLWSVIGSVIADIISMVIRLIVTIYIVKDEAKTMYSIFKMELVSIVPMLFMCCGLIPSYLWFIETINVQIITFKCVIVLLYLVLVIVFNRDYLKVIIKMTKKKE